MPDLDETNQKTGGERSEVATNFTRNFKVCTILLSYFYLSEKQRQRGVVSHQML